MSEVSRRSGNICGDDDEGGRTSVAVRCGTWKRRKLGLPDCLTERMSGNEKANYCQKRAIGTES